MGVEFRAVEDDRDSRFPLMPQVSVDGGETWHPVRAMSMTVRERVDEPTSIELTVLHWRRGSE